MKEETMRLVLVASLAAGMALFVVVPAMATTGKGQLFHDGTVVGTVVTPAPIAAGSGTDPFFKVTNGADGQLGIAGVAPGDGPYHGGSWQVDLGRGRGRCQGGWRRHGEPGRGRRLQVSRHSVSIERFTERSCDEAHCEE